VRCRDYLDILKATLKVPSDYALAKQLHVTRSAVSSYRRGKSTFDHVVAARVAKILSIAPVRVIAEAEIERAKTTEQRQVWATIRDAAVVALMALGASTFGGFNNNAFAAPSGSAVAGPECTLHSFLLKVTNMEPAPDPDSLAAEILQCHRRPRAVAHCDRGRTETATRRAALLNQAETLPEQLF
jgi:transcriptional regulator with XRE-family HTH domain